VIARFVGGVAEDLSNSWSFLMHDFDDDIGDLQDAILNWADTENGKPIVELLPRLLDRSGVPLRLKRSYWNVLLKTLREVEKSSPNESVRAIRKTIDSFELVVRAFERPDGTAIWSEVDQSAAIRSKRRRVTVADEVDGRIDSDASSTLESKTADAVPLGVFRSASDQAWLAVDDRNPVDSFQIEFGLKRRVFLGPGEFRESLNQSDWNPNPRILVPTIHWVQGPNAHLFEWTWRSNGNNVTRTAALLGNEGVAILAEEVDDRGQGAVMRVEIPEGIEAVSIPESSSIRLIAKRGASVVVVPLAISPFPGTSDQGSLGVEEYYGKRYIVLAQPSVPGARRLWLPLAIVWRPIPSRTILRRKKLTVSEKSAVCRPGVAFAARLPWGVGDSLLIYRSLAKKSLRAVLGHYVKSSFVLAKFNADGDIDPIVAID
jgi:hypothetical protein